MADIYSEGDQKRLNALRDELIRGNPPGLLARPLSGLEGDPVQFKKQFPSRPGSEVDAIKMPVTGGIGITSVGAENPNLAGIKNTVNKGLGVIGDILSGKYKYTGVDLIPGNAWDKHDQAMRTKTANTVEKNGIAPTEVQTTTGNIKPQFTTADLSRKSDGSLPGKGMGVVESPTEARHPAEGFADVYSYAESLSPEKFKRFVDRNQDKEGFAGFGYIEAKDPKTGKMKLEKVISRPEERGGGNGMGGIDLSKATIGDLEAIGPIINAMEMRKENALYHRGLLSDKEESRNIQRMAVEGEVANKNEGRKDKIISSYSPAIYDEETGKPVSSDTHMGTLLALSAGEDIGDRANNAIKNEYSKIISDFDKLYKGKRKLSNYDKMKMYYEGLTAARKPQVQ